MGDYVVVIFHEENTVALVSASWIIQEGEVKYCYWPAHRQSAKARNHEMPEKETWGRYQIRVLKETNDFAKATRYARQAEDTSNVESEDETRRRIRIPSRFQQFSGSDCDNDSEPDLSVRRSPRKRPAVKLPNPPKKMQLSSPDTAVRPKLTTNESSPKTLKPTSISNGPLSTSIGRPSTSNSRPSTSNSRPFTSNSRPSTSNSRPSTSSGCPSSGRPSTSNWPSTACNTESSFQVNVLLKLQTLEEGQQKLMDKLQNLAKLRQEDKAEDAEAEPFENPMDSEDEFAALEARLAVGDFKKKMIRYLSLVGGYDIGQTVRSILHKLGTNHLWSSFNILGRKGKRGLKLCRIFSVIVKSCIKNHPNAKEVEVERALGFFLKRTPNLPGGTKYKRPDSARAPSDDNDVDTPEGIDNESIEANTSQSEEDLD